MTYFSSGTRMFFLCGCALFTVACSDSDGDLFTGGNSQQGGTSNQGGQAGGVATGGDSSTGGANAGGTNGVGGETNAGGGGAAPSICGDFKCDPGECATCSPDCGATCTAGCGDGTCDQTEDCSTCPADCQTGCGDGCCLLGENCQNCAADCATVEGCDPTACGNNQCNYGLSETCLNCADCFGLCDCGDNACVDPETPANCPWDCGG